MTHNLILERRTSQVIPGWLLCVWQDATCSLHMLQIQASPSSVQQSPGPQSAPHLPKKPSAWDLLHWTLTHLSFTLSLRLFLEERTLELEKRCLKLWLCFHKELDDDPLNSIGKSPPKWIGSAREGLEFPEPQRTLVNQLLQENISGERKQGTGLWNSTQHGRYLAVFHFGQHDPGLWPLSVVTHQMVRCLLCVLWCR